MIQCADWHDMQAAPASSDTPLPQMNAAGRLLEDPTSPLAYSLQPTTFVRAPLSAASISASAHVQPPQPAGADAPMATVELRPKQHRQEVEARKLHNAQLAAGAIALRPAMSV